MTKNVNSVPTVSFILRSIQAFQPFKAYVNHYTTVVSPHRKSVSSGTPCDSSTLRGTIRDMHSVKQPGLRGGAVG
jgi:hypothetical protein